MSTSPVENILDNSQRCYWIKNFLTLIMNNITSVLRFGDVGADSNIALEYNMVANKGAAINFATYLK